MVAPRPLPLLLGSLLLAAGCFPPGAPPDCKCQAGFVCVEGDCQPLACDALDETDCLSRADCQANYAETANRCAAGGEDQVRCGGYSQVFMGCSTKVCAAVMCDLYCAHGMAKDANGCEVCACAPADCSADQECLPGEACVFPELECPPNAFCAPPRGVCTVVEDPGCGGDSECQAGERCVFPDVHCPPNAFCAPPRGTCKPEGGCLTDADCGVGRRCELLGTCLAIGCEAPAMGGVCVERTPCADGSECGWGQTCALDPNDPCIDNACLMWAPAQTWCIPTCDLLGEAECLSRRDCEARYEGPRCGNDPTPASFVGCTPAACPPVMCEMWCEKGFEVDQKGCSLCACDDSCLSDADCTAGQRCELPVYDACPPGEYCPPLRGACVGVPLCTDDSQCGPGQVCSMPELVCPPDVECPMPTGVCVDVQPLGCTDDSQCLPGQRCDYDPMLNCGGATNCAGACVPNECRSDADCRAGESCVFLMDACPPGDPACPNTGICNATSKGCGGDADCAANEQCVLVDCGPNMDCLQQGVCAPRP